MNNLPAYLHTPDREDEFEPSYRPEPGRDEPARCIVCQSLLGYGLRDTCSPECERDYREGISAQVREEATS